MDFCSTECTYVTYPLCPDVKLGYAKDREEAEYWEQCCFGGREVSSEGNHSVGKEQICVAAFKNTTVDCCVQRLESTGLKTRLNPVQCSILKMY